MTKMTGKKIDNSPENEIDFEGTWRVTASPSWRE
jgi:hypothetical protein